jgi:hypothetical protein
LERTRFLSFDSIAEAERFSEWNSYPETFWINPWVAKHLLEIDANSLFYIVDQWLADEPLPDFIDPDPLVEDQKVKDLHRLFSALNR